MTPRWPMRTCSTRGTRRARLSRADRHHDPRRRGARCAGRDDRARRPRRRRPPAAGNHARRTARRRPLDHPRSAQPLGRPRPHPPQARRRHLPRRPGPDLARARADHDPARGRSAAAPDRSAPRARDRRRAARPRATPGRSSGAEISRLCDVLLVEVDAGRPWRPADAAFHGAIYDASGNPMFGQILSQSRPRAGALGGIAVRPRRVRHATRSRRTASSPMPSSPSIPPRAVAAINHILDIVEDEIKAIIGLTPATA